METRRLSRSAPAGSDGNSKRKWGASGVSTQKEIESWARQGQSASLDLSRHSGQLADNVTEERMLYGKLLEMSKERYKFLSHNNYEQKTFLDRQKMKSSALRHKLNDVGTNGQRIQWIAPSRDNTSTSMSEKRKSVCQSRSAIGTASDVHPGAVDEHPERKVRLKSGPSALGYRRDKLFPTETSSVGSSVTSSAADNGKLPDVGAATVDQRKTPGVRFAGERRESRSKASHHPPERRAASAQGRLTTAKDKPVEDRRYVGLANTLCHNYGLEKKKVNVNDIIKTLDSLHVAPKRVYTVAKPKTSVFLQRFLQERGIAF